ncbi:MAG: GTP 3',8-cyclase MoaA [Nitrososphaerales archaeon]
MSANKLQNQLIDGFGRVARKLRISVTDRCNMRCMYCMPSNNAEWFEQKDVLSYEEITRLAKIFAGLGIEKIRITGGEPTVRHEIEKLIGELSKVDGIKSISMTTNGLLLHDNVKKLKEAGLASVNVSLDTFRSDRFKAITGIDGVGKVLASIKAADYVGLKVKINTVVVRGWNDDEVVDFAKFAMDTGYIVRFIEFMPLDGTGMWTPDLVFSKKEIMERINNSICKLVPLDDHGSDPEMLYSIGDKGIVGFIPSITEPFCSRCDRVRITANGRFLGCLFEHPGYDLNSLLRNGKSDGEISKYIAECFKKKPEGIVSIIKTKSLRPAMNAMYKIGG